MGASKKAMRSERQSRVPTRDMAGRPNFQRPGFEDLCSVLLPTTLVCYPRPGVEFGPLGRFDHRVERSTFSSF